MQCLENIILCQSLEKLYQYAFPISVYQPFPLKNVCMKPANPQIPCSSIGTELCSSFSHHRCPMHFIPFPSIASPRSHTFPIFFPFSHTFPIFPYFSHFPILFPYFSHFPIIFRENQALPEEAGLADSDLAAYARRLSLVQAIYEDRGRRRPQLPWEDDAYRRCQYQVG